MELDWDSIMELKLSSLIDSLIEQFKSTELLVSSSQFPLDENSDVQSFEKIILDDSSSGIHRLIATCELYKKTRFANQYTLLTKAYVPMMLSVPDEREEVNFILTSILNESIKTSKNPGCIDLDLIEDLVNDVFPHLGIGFFEKISVNKFYSFALLLHKFTDDAFLVFKSFLLDMNDVEFLSKFIDAYPQHFSGHDLQEMLHICQTQSARNTEFTQRKILSAYRLWLADDLPEQLKSNSVSQKSRPTI